MQKIKRSTNRRGTGCPNGRPFAWGIGRGYMEFFDNQYLNQYLNQTKPNLNQTKQPQRSRPFCGQVSNRLPPSLRSVAFENPCRIHASLTDRPESMKKPQTARGGGCAWPR